MIKNSSENGKNHLFEWGLCCTKRDFRDENRFVQHFYHLLYYTRFHVFRQVYIAKKHVKPAFL